MELHLPIPYWFDCNVAIAMSGGVVYPVYTMDHHSIRFSQECLCIGVQPVAVACTNLLSRIGWS